MIERLLTLSVVTLLTMISPTLADGLPDFSAKMEVNEDNRASGVETSFLEEGLAVGLPTGALSDMLQKPSRELLTTSRSAKDTQIYKLIAPSVVLIVVKDGLGSGSLLSSSGDILTNYHVVKGFNTVAVIFKPEKEGVAPGRDDVKLGEVVRFDPVTDLALLRAKEVPPGRNPIRLGSSDDISVGADVHAIGHPTGEAWTYTTGIISQYRLAYKWKSSGDDVQHTADIIQTQTPINSGNSGGPLINDAGALVGVNSFKAPGSEGLNFAVSVDDVKRFLLRSNQANSSPVGSTNAPECKPKILSKYRSQDNTSQITSLDMFCDGRPSGEYVVPDKASASIFLRVDRNGDGKADVIFFDLKRSGKWDISWWDDKYSGQWSLVGYHEDGTLKPSRFESYSDYQKRRLANRQPN
jgi:S1-C subfamily serine protease